MSCKLHFKVKKCAIGNPEQWKWHRVSNAVSHFIYRKVFTRPYWVLIELGIRVTDKKNPGNWFSWDLSAYDLIKKREPKVGLWLTTIGYRSTSYLIYNWNLRNFGRIRGIRFGCSESHSTAPVRPLCGSEISSAVSFTVSNKNNHPFGDEIYSAVFLYFF
jgi:hypothetical protein